MKNKVLQPFRSQSMSTACQRLLDLEAGLSIQENQVTMWTLVSSPTLVKVSDLVSEPRNSSLNGCKEIWRKTQLLELTLNTTQQPPSLELKALLSEPFSVSSCSLSFWEESIWVHSKKIMPNLNDDFTWNILKYQYDLLSFSHFFY